MPYAAELRFMPERAAERGMAGAATAEAYAGLDALPPEGAALLHDSAAGEFFASRAWFEAVLRAGMPAGRQAGFVLCRLGARPAALVPLMLPEHGRGAAGLTTPYTCLFGPLFAPGLSPEARREAGRAFGRHCRRWPVLRLDCLPGDDPALEEFVAGTGEAGLAAVRFTHFGNWHEAVDGQSWDEYLAGRPGSLRSTVRRKLRRGEGAMQFALHRGGPDLEAGIAAFEAVYARSWKEPEPFPEMNAAAMRAAAGLGVLRLGILSEGGTPVAAQFWTLAGGTATVLKLAHDRDRDALSPGTVLTALMLRGMFGEGGVAAVDFGRGDDPYKRLWAAERRQRIGISLVNPRRPAGLAYLARHHLGRQRRRIAGWLRPSA